MVEKITFDIICKGRDRFGYEVLERPVDAKVTVHQVTEKDITLYVKCKHNAGGHGERCEASYPNQRKKGTEIGCVYAADIPYIFDRRIR